jgi:hypothetical protein
VKPKTCTRQNACCATSIPAINTYAIVVLCALSKTATVVRPNQPLVSRWWLGLSLVAWVVVGWLVVVGDYCSDCGQSAGMLVAQQAFGDYCSDCGQSAGMLVAQQAFLRSLFASSLVSLVVRLRPCCFHSCRRFSSTLVPVDSTDLMIHADGYPNPVASQPIAIDCCAQVGIRQSIGFQPIPTNRGCCSVGTHTWIHTWINIYMDQ